VAAILGLVVVLSLLLIGLPAGFVGGKLGALLGYISILTHIRGFVVGMIDLRDVAYFLSLTAFFLFLSAKVIESRKWR
jgi:ABC-2 type transport system permease protein